MLVTGIIHNFTAVPIPVSMNSYVSELISVFRRGTSEVDASAVTRFVPHCKRLVKLIMSQKKFKKSSTEKRHHNEDFSVHLAEIAVAQAEDKSKLGYWSKLKNGDYTPLPCQKAKTPLLLDLIGEDAELTNALCHLILHLQSTWLNCYPGELDDDFRQELFSLLVGLDGRSDWPEWFTKSVRTEVS